MKARIGFVGLGLMGNGMARNIAQKGFPLTIYNRTRAKAVSLAAEVGCEIGESPRAVTEVSDIVITMVSDVADVDEVYFGPTGIVDALFAGRIAVDMGTVGAACARRVGAAVEAKGAAFVDAPVSGGSWGAANGTLSIMAGGTEAAFATVVPVFEAMGSKIVHCGPIGSGQSTKMVNQVVGALNLESAAEGILLALRCGLDVAKTLDAVGGGAAASWAWTNLAPRMAAEDFAPGFKIAHQIKDLRLALQAAAEVGVTLPGTQLVLTHLESVQAMLPDGGERGTQTVIRALQPPE